MSGFERPVLKLLLAPWERRLEYIAVAGVLASALAVALGWNLLPARIPTHFGATGEPDAWGSKSTILPVPLIAVVLYALLTLLQRFPHICNYPVRLTPENVEREYRIARAMFVVLKTGIVWTLAILEVLMVQGMRAGHLDVFLANAVMGAMIGAAFMTIAIGVIQCRRAR